MLLGIGLILWKPSPPAKQISAANVNKELFLPAYRALESPLDSPTLASELQAISPSLKTDDERQLYQLFGTMLELRADRKNIDMYGRLIEQLKTRSADARKEMSKSNTLSARDIELNSAFCTFVDRIAAIDSRGGIITQCLENTDGPRGHIVGSIRQCAVKELAEKHGLATRSEDRFKVIDSKVLDSHITKIKNATMKQIKAVMDQ